MYRLLSAAALAAAFSLPLLGATPAAATTSTAAVSVRITLSCYSNPERTTVKNTGTVAFKITRVGSTYQPYSYEPFHVSKTLKPGKSVTFQTGRSASGIYELSHNYIYNDNGKDGTRVKTSVGTYTKHC